MKLLITGASGFLGAHLMERLGRDHDVTGLCRRPGSRDRCVAGDVLDPATLTGPLEGCDVVVHAAGGVSHRPEDSDWLHEVHVGGTENVLAAALAAGVDRVIHVSSSGTVAVSEKDRVHDEDSPEPLAVIGGWPYYRAKLFAEQAALAGGAISINPSLLLGPGDTEMSSTGSVKLLLDGSLLVVPGGGLSFVDVRDVAEAVALAIEHGTPGERYLLGAANLSLADYYARLARIADLPAPKLTLPAVGGRMMGWLPLGVKQAVADRFGADTFELEMASHYWYLDSSKAERDLGWSPRDPGETLADTVRDLRTRTA